MERIVRVACDRVHHARPQEIPSEPLFDRPKMAGERPGRHLKHATHGDPSLQSFGTALEDRISFRVADDWHDALRAELTQNFFGGRR